MMRIIRLMMGLFLFALGIVFTLRANIGYAPWDVFHAGLAGTLGITIGLASILTGLTLLLVVAAMKETLGLGTVFNMIFVGAFMDLILGVGVIPLADGYIISIVMLALGFALIALASYFYISSAFGAGPRDSLMILLARKTGKLVGVCRAGVELTAVVTGFFLGGQVGAGTVIAAFGIGLFVQLVFRLLKFDVSSVKHESLAQSYREIRNLL